MWQRLKLSQDTISKLRNYLVANQEIEKHKNGETVPRLAITEVHTCRCHCIPTFIFLS